VVVAAAAAAPVPAEALVAPSVLFELLAQPTSPVRASPTRIMVNRRIAPPQV
jgi:hypothetical protein